MTLACGGHRLAIFRVKGGGYLEATIISEPIDDKLRLAVIILRAGSSSERRSHGPWEILRGRRIVEQMRVSPIDANRRLCVTGRRHWGGE